MHMSSDELSPHLLHIGRLGEACHQMHPLRDLGERYVVRGTVTLDYCNEV